MSFLVGDRTDSQLIDELKSLNEARFKDDPEIPGYYFRNKQREQLIHDIRHELARRLGIELNHDGSAN